MQTFYIAKEMHHVSHCSSRNFSFEGCCTPYNTITLMIHCVITVILYMKLDIQDGEEMKKPFIVYDSLGMKHVRILRKDINM